MTDEKMIEEMAKDIFESKVAIDGSDMAFGLFDEDDHFHRIARFLYKHNYRKLPENAVVLAKEKYILANKVYSDTTLKSWKKEDLIEHIRILEYNWKNAEESLNIQAKNCEMLLQQARKETAKEVLDKVYDWGQGFFIEHSFMEEDEFNGILDEVKKLFLNVVEVEK